MKKIIFVCHGSICRSPAAEMIFRKRIKELGIENGYIVSSLALSNEEIGNDIYPPMKRCLERHGIPYIRHQSRRITQNDLDNTDYLFYMDKSNERIISYYLNDKDHKCKPVFFYSKGIYEIEDPWYTDNYDLVINELEICINDIIDNIK